MIAKFALMAFIKIILHFNVSLVKFPIALIVRMNLIIVLNAKLAICSILEAINAFLAHLLIV